MSGRTSYVVVGSEPGASKMDKVKKLGIRILDEDQFYEIIRTRPAQEEVVSKEVAKIRQQHRITEEIAKSRRESEKERQKEREKDKQKEGQEQEKEEREGEGEGGAQKTSKYFQSAPLSPPTQLSPAPASLAVSLVTEKRTATSPQEKAKPLSPKIAPQ